MTALPTWLNVLLVLALFAAGGADALRVLRRHPGLPLERVLAVETLGESW